MSTDAEGLVAVTNGTASEQRDSLLLAEPNRLAVLMVLAGVSGRELSRAAGWASHSYVRRLLAGERCAVRREPAERIAARLGVRVDEIFVSRVTGDSVRSDRQGVGA